eukprot:1155746-Pelagomonas_calceolata.AAC.13
MAGVVAVNLQWLGITGCSHLTMAGHHWSQSPYNGWASLVAVTLQWLGITGMQPLRNGGPPSHKHHALRNSAVVIHDLQEGAGISEASRAIHRRALEAIEASKHKTKRLSRSPSPVNTRVYPSMGYGSPNSTLKCAASKAGLSRPSAPSQLHPLLLSFDPHWVWRRGSWSGGDAAWPQSGAAYGGYRDGDAYGETHAAATPTRAAPARPLSAPFSQSPSARAPYPYHQHDPPQQQRQQQRLQDAYSAFPQQGFRAGRNSGSEEDRELPRSAYGGGYASGYGSEHDEAPEWDGDDAVLERDTAVQASRDPDRAGEVQERGKGMPCFSEK